jgi:DNA adenine methylase
MIPALVPWYGSKRTIAPRIVEELGPHSVYWEPFAGSAATLLAKPPSRVEVLNDLHGHATNLARVIRDPIAGARFYRQARRILFSEGVFEDAIQTLGSIGVHASARFPDVDRAVAFIIASWMGRNGHAGTNTQTGLAVRYSDSGGDPAVRWQSVVRSIPAWRSRLARVQILQRDAFQLLAKIADRPRVAIYVDPPYLAKSAKYVHDFDAADHDRLATALARFRRARVVVSYYAHPRLADLYPADRWKTKPVDVRQFMGNTSGESAGSAPEVLISNAGERCSAS